MEDTTNKQCDLCPEKGLFVGQQGLNIHKASALHKEREISSRAASSSVLLHAHLLENVERCADNKKLSFVQEHFTLDYKDPPINYFVSDVEPRDEERKCCFLL